ncbi:hypothetical protein [Winogradskyella immobilis]|uniref:Uncharacterized protein n=1 Tax=Winogradskyella immobilis TaxID=2816852 RepID=A0ABS8EK69_9FLAO|nr:hypothetical protein [Winogradskyella immobilis]MCC1483553.1 hypothetical protein [Winogradskyella immobilis]MCG0015647.1 hypothetical protein [Winogradskyella immobilis]
MKKEDLNNIKKPGFKIPEGYFRTFEEQLNERIKLEDAVFNTKQTGFSVPENYFNSVEDNIISHLPKTKNNVSVISINSRRSLYYISGIAASLLLLFAIFTNKEEPLELSVDMVESYFESQDINSYELAELLVDIELIDDDFTITKNTYDEVNLETYLLDNADLDAFLE